VPQMSKGAELSFTLETPYRWHRSIGNAVRHPGMLRYHSNSYVIVGHHPPCYTKKTSTVLRVISIVVWYSSSCEDHSDVVQDANIPN
jgi:hypothetical protein